MSLSTANFVLGLVAFVALTAAGFVIVRAKYMTTTASTLKSAVDSWREEAEAQTARGDRLEAEVARLKLRVEHLEQTGAVLSELATGTPELRQLVALIGKAIAVGDERHNENLASLTRLEGGISRLETGLLKGAK